MRRRAGPSGGELAQTMPDVMKSMAQTSSTSQVLFKDVDDAQSKNGNPNSNNGLNTVNLETKSQTSMQQSIPANGFMASSNGF